MLYKGVQRLRLFCVGASGVCSLAIAECSVIEERDGNERLRERGIADTWGPLLLHSAAWRPAAAASSVPSD